MSKSESSIAIVTGASRGIGRATAYALAVAGHYVVVNYVSNEAGAVKTLDLIREAGGQGELSRFNVGESDEVEEALSRLTSERSRPVEVLVNNAGVTSDGLLVEMDADETVDLWKTNLLGAFLCIQQVLPVMLFRRYGRIINVSSVMTQRPNRGTTAYAASKGGIEALTRALAVEVGSRGITVNAVAPGFVNTDMTAEYTLSKKGRDVTSLNSIGRPGTPEEVAAAIRFLASAEASFINGHILAVDGGANQLSLL